MESTTRPLSISSLRLWLRCPHAWELRYRAGYRPRLGARAWRGSLVHRIIQQVYAGLSLPEAHDHVWQAACGPLLPRLERLVALDADYAAAGSPRTKVAQRWREEHPEFDRLEGEAAAFARTALGHLRWGERDSLADTFRATRHLRAADPTELLLPGAFLVEGQPLDALTADLPPAESIAADEDEEDGERPHLLRGELWGVPVYGVPDVVARDGDAVLVLDYKTGRRHLSPQQLAEDAQLAIYAELLRQHGHVEPGQPVRVGHRYLGERGEISTIWARDDQHPRVLERLSRQVAAARAMIDAGLFAPVRGVDPAMGPCALCDLSHHCRA